MLSVFLYLILSTYVHSALVNSQNNAISKQQLLEHLSYLSSNELAGRKIASMGNKKAQQYIINQLESHSILPLNQYYQHDFLIKKTFRDIKGSNVIAMIPGSDIVGSYIILSAHFDHIGKKGKKIYNGADDNASGTSALLALGQKLIKAPLKHSVILLFTDGEEINLKGAKAFVKDHETIIGHTKLNINLDMLAGSKKTTKLRYMARGLNKLMDESDIERLQIIQTSSDVPIKKGFKVKNFRSNRHRKWIMSSDHGVFHRAGIPFLYFGVGTHINYHQYSDTFSNVNHDFFHLATNAIYHQLIFIDHNI